MPYSPVTLGSYAGLNEDENPLALRNDQLREAFNVCRLGNLTGTRPGLVRDSEYDADISGAPPIQGAFEYRQNRDENRSMVAVAGDQVYTDDTTQLTQAVGTAITAGAGNLWTFANHQNLMWAAGGASGDSIWTWDGSGNVTPQLASLSLRPKYVFQKWNTLFLSGLRGGTSATDNPLVARYPDFAADATLPASWNAANTIPGQNLTEASGVGSYGNEFSTGFGSYQDNSGDFLLFLTNRRLVAFRENPNATTNADRFAQTDAVATGCVGQNAFVDLGFDQGDAVYASEHGIHSLALSQQYGNRENNFLSWRIRKTWESINRSMLDRFCGGYWPEEGLVLFAIATGSSTHLDTILAMDIKGVREITPDTVRWYKWRVSAAQANYITSARDPDGVPRIYFGGQGGELAPFSRSAYSDLGGTLPASFRSRDEDYGAPTTEKAIGDTWIMVGGSGNYRPSLSYVVDDGRRTILSTTIPVALSGFTMDNAAGNLPGASIMDNAAGDLAGAGVLGADFNLRRVDVDAYGEGFTLSHRFAHSGVNEPFFIGQISQDVDGNGLADEAA